MGTTVTETPGEDYTWSNSDFSWTSPQAGLRSWRDAHVSTWNILSAEEAGITDTLGNALSKSLFEDLHVTDAVRKAILLFAKEAVTVGEGYVDNVAFQLRVIEAVTLLEKVGKDVQLAESETFRLIDSLKKVIGLNKLEAVNILETFSRTVSFVLNQRESLGVTAAASRHTEVFKMDALGFTETSAREVGLGVVELVAFAETFGRTVLFKRAITEGLSVADALAKAFEVGKAETLRFVEALMRNSNAVVSDMLVSSQDVSFQDFLKIVNTGRIPGFTDFRTFVQGDYEYSEAMFRVLLDATSSDRGAVSDLKVSVDVPDVFDRGLAFIEDADSGLYVPFTRPFHIVPEMSLLLKGGTTIAIPRLITLDEYGFTVKLYNMNEVAVTGSVSWSAHGY